MSADYFDQQQQLEQWHKMPRIKEDCFSSQAMGRRDMTPNPPLVPPNTYSTRIATFTTWPHTAPSASTMARCGFRQVHGHEHYDTVECTECHIQLREWHPQDHANVRHLRLSRQYCPFLEPMRRTAHSNKALPSTTSFKTPFAPATGTAKPVELPVRTRQTTPYFACRLVSPIPEHVMSKSCDKESDDTPAKTGVSTGSMEDVPLDVEDWVDLAFEGEEKDGWIEV